MSRYLGKRYGRPSQALGVMGLKSFIATLTVVDETKNSVALKDEDESHNLTLIWVLKTDLLKGLEEITE